MKQTKLLLLILVMLIPIMANAEPEEIDGIYYNLVSKVKTAEVTSNPNFYSGNVVIPQTVTYDGNEYSVTSIGEKAFHQCSNLTSVTLPNSVTSIGYFAFAACNGLISFNIPNSVTFIDAGAFSNCKGLTSMTLPNSVTSISDYTFFGCSNLATVTIPNSVTSIGENAFEKCSGLTSVTIPNSVTVIDLWAFKGCSSLTSVTIPNSVTWVRSLAFSGCSGLTTISIGNGVTSIGDKTFAECPELTDVYCMAENVPECYFSAFEGSYIESATLHVPEDAITKYEEIKPWSGFKYIKAIRPMYTLIYTIDEVVYKSEQIEEGTTITSEPAPIKEGYTFSGWSEIPETMPAHDVTISGNFTINNYKLTYQVDGEDYKSYEVEYGSSITPEPAPTKEGYTFSGWSENPETMPAKDVTVTGTFSINKYKLIYMVDGEEYKSYDVDYGSSITPESTPTKEGYTFSGWSEIPETMPAKDVTVTGNFSINKYKLIYMVDGEEYKSYDVEYGSSITPETTPTKEGYTFSGWSEIPETMPAKDVTVTGTFSANVIEEEEGKFEVTSENTVEIIDDDNVSGAYSIPESISHDGVSYSVTSIGDGAFMGNTNLTDITIPSSITSIGSSAFSGCSNLKTITVNIEKPISLTTEAGVRGGTRSTSSVFEGVDLTTCILYVPEGSVDAYKAAPVWKEFVNILAIGTTGINGIVVSNGEAFDVFSISGQKVKAKATSLDGLPKGIYVINGQKILKK